MSTEKENDAVRGTSNVYGVVSPGRAAGKPATEGPKDFYTFHLTGQQLSDEIVEDVVIPANTHVVKAYVFVEEVFDLATSSVVELGEDGSESTNGVSILEADLESTGYVDLTSQLAGTFDETSLITSNTTIGVAFSAGSVSDATAGKARVVIEVEKSK